MTPRKFFAIYDEFCDMSGVKKETAGTTIDQLP